VVEFVGNISYVYIELELLFHEIESNNFVKELSTCICLADCHMERRYFIILLLLSPLTTTVSNLLLLCIGCLRRVFTVTLKFYSLLNKY